MKCSTRRTPGPGVSRAGLVPWVFGLIGAVFLAGCAGPAVREPQRLNATEARYAQEGEKIKADPVAFLRDLSARCDALPQYRLVFCRQERSGLPPQLGPLEEIRAAFRKEPFSVKFEWDDENMPYYESVYVQGQNQNLLIVRERKGAFLFVPPQVRALDLMLPVKLGKSKNPVTDFGLGRIVKRTLLPFENPEIAKVMTIKYQGLVMLDPMNRPAHYLRIDRPKIEGLAYTRQDFYVDAETLLPAGSDLYLPSGQMDARYRYADIDTQVNLTDADFRLSKDHPVIKPGKQ